MPNYFDLSTVDERCMWAAVRALSLHYNRAGGPAVATFMRSVQDSLLAYQNIPSAGNTPAFMTFSFRGINVVLISGIPNSGAALRFVTAYGEFAPATPLNSVALSGGDAIAPFLIEQYRQNPARTLFAGWSYGGVVAQYLAAAWVDLVNNDDRRVLTYGSPRPAKRPFGPTYNGIETTRVCNIGDPLPYLIPWHTEDAAAYWAYRAYRAFSEPDQWTHFGRGVRLSDAGLDWTQQMPSFPQGGIGTSIVGWATGLMTAPVGEHTIASYEARLSVLVPAAGADGHAPGVVFPVPPGPAFGLPLANPIDPPIRDREPIPVREIEQLPPKPPGVRDGPTFYARSQLTGPNSRKEWWVWHWDQPIFRTKNKTQAKRTASRLNSVQLAWLNSTAGDQQDLIDAIELEFPAS